MEVADRPIHELVDLVRGHKIDAWDVDIEKLTSVYLEKIRRMKELDIRVPGRVLLSAALLLRMKTESATNGNGKEKLEAELEELLEMEMPDLGEVTLMQFVPRKITVLDLLGALKDALNEMPEAKEKIAKKIEKIIWKSEGLESLFRELEDALLKRIIDLANSGKTVSLFGLVKNRTRSEFSMTFITLLFLCNEKKIALEQPEEFGDILVIPKGVK